MKTKYSLLVIIVVALLATTTFASTLVSAQTGSVTIKTNKDDYTPTDTVVITGSGFLPNHNIALTLTGPIGFTTKTWSAQTDINGNLQTTYNQGLMDGTFNLQATDGTKTATTTFTDDSDKEVYARATAGGSITYAPKGTGSGTVDAGTTSKFTVPAGTKISFTAIAQTGYIFSGWSGASQSGTENPLNLGVGSGIGSSASPLTATFTQNLQPTTLTIGVTPTVDKYMPDAAGVIHGYLTSLGRGVGGCTVSVRYNDGSGSGWQPLYSVDTYDNDGGYFVYYNIYPSMPNGYIAFEATFAGDDNYEASGSVYTGAVGEQAGNLHVVPEYFFGGLAALGACFVGFVVFKKRSSLPQLHLK